MTINIKLNWWMLLLFSLKTIKEAPVSPNKPLQELNAATSHNS